MKIFSHLFLSVIIAICIENILAKYLLVEVDNGVDQGIASNDAWSKTIFDSSNNSMNRSLKARVTGCSPSTCPHNHDLPCRKNCADSSDCFGRCGPGNNHEVFPNCISGMCTDDKCETNDQCSGGLKCFYNHESDIKECLNKKPKDPPNPVIGPFVDSSGCFHGSNKVLLENGKRKLISEVKVEDEILAVDEMGILQVSQVVMQLHQAPEQTAMFHVIQTKTGRKLTLTQSHLIYKSKRNPGNNLKEFSSSEPVFASKVEKGDLVYVLDENDKLIKEEIVSTHLETRKGIYSPVTAHGTIIVEDILASCYSDYEGHSLIHMVFAPVRWIHNARNAMLANKRNGEYDVSGCQPENMGHHWYSEALVAVADNLVPEKMVFV